MPISLYPKVEKPAIRVIISVLDDRESFYRQWGTKIEQTLRSIDGVENVEATYRQGRATITIHFKWKVEPKTAKLEVSKITSFYQGQLPSHWPPIRVDFLDPGSENYAAITSDRYSPAELSKMLKLNLLPKLESMPGVSAAWVSDRDKPYMLVEARPYDLLNYSIEIGELEKSLRAHAYDLNLGLLQTNNQGKLTVVISRGFDNIDEIKNITIKSSSNLGIKLSDIADVYWETEQNIRTFLYNNDEVVAVALWPEPGANIYELSNDFLIQLKLFAQDVGDVLILNSPVNFIKEAIYNILFALCLGMLTATLVVFFFYRRVANTLIICFSMPIALCMSLLVMRLTNVGINLISLGAMSIVIGMVVDSTILVIDRINQNLVYKKLDTLESINCIISSILEVKQSIISSILTSIVVFIPLIYTTPFISSILRDVVLVTVAILISSILLSLVIIPSIYMLLLQRKSQIFTRAIIDKTAKVDVATLQRITSFVNFLTNSNLRKRVLLISLLLVCILIISFVTPNVHREIIAQPRAEIIDIGVSFPSEYLDRHQKINIITPIKNKITGLVGEHVKYIYSDIRPNIAYLSLHLNSYRDFEYVFKKLNQAVKEKTLEDVTVDPWITSSLNIKETPEVQMFFNAANNEENRKYLKSTLNFVKQHPMVRYAKGVPRASKSKVMQIELDNENIDLLLSGKNYLADKNKLNSFIKYSLEPQKLFDFDIGSGLVDLKLKVKTETEGINSILSLPYKISNKEVFVNQLYKANLKNEWRDFYSNNARESYVLEVWINRNVSMSNVKKLEKDIRAHLKKLFNLSILPVTFKDSGMETRAALLSVQYSLLFSVILVFLVLLYQFKRIQIVLVVMSVIPFGICGALVALYLFNSTLSINSMLGMLIVVGLSVNNSIILVDGFNRFLALGNSQVDSIIKSIKGRIRALMVTNLTTISSMVPLAIGFGPGQDILQPLGISVLFGLIFSVVASLIVVPVLLSYSSIVWNYEA